MFFKGLSIARIENSSSSGFSGIGVFMERSPDLPAIRVQKNSIFMLRIMWLINWLSWMACKEAVQNNISRVYAFTDSGLLYDQITFEKNMEMPLLMTLTELILELAKNFEAFVLKLVSSTDLEQPNELAKVAIGLVTFPVNSSSHMYCCSEQIVETLSAVS